ncbi:MAG: hypothetical protein KTR30_31870 [Saprospiraceae bacterium]|nr:hypothetical protein [Saprospiraceae bacterium]
MNNNSLDLNQQEFAQLLAQSAQLVLEQFEQLTSAKAYHYHPQQEVAAWFDEALPLEGMDTEALLAEVRKKVMHTATGNLGPNMYAYVMAGGTQVSIVAEQLAATINQNVTKWHLAPAISEIEKRVIQWSAEMMGLEDMTGGVMVSGGSAANLTGLTVARNIAFEKFGVRKKGLFGLPPFTVYAAQEVHGCVDKSLDLLGIGTDQLRKIRTLPDFTIDLQALEEQIIVDQANGFHPFCVIGNAGTVNTGAIDDLDALAAIAKKYEMWFHIDGAYGGLAASLGSLQAEYKGLSKADSIAIDFHKWLYQPFEAGCTLVKNWDTLRRTYFKKADYLDTALEEDRGRLEFNEHTFQLSRNAKALKVWMSMKAYGIRRIKDMIQKDIDLAHYLADQVEQVSDFELKSRSELAVTCFRYTGNFDREAEIIDINARLIAALEKDGRVFITGTRLNDEFVLRACLTNHRKQKESIDYLLNVIRETAKTLQHEPQPSY